MIVLAISNPGPEGLYFIAVKDGFRFPASSRHFNRRNVIDVTTTLATFSVQAPAARCSNARYSDV